MTDRAHGIMFHHFYNADKHIQAQGELNEDDFINPFNYYL